MHRTLLVIAKQPRPGAVKTRLCPPCSPDQAAELAFAALRDTLAAVAAAHADRRVLVLDGEPGPWVPAGFDVLPQRPGDLGARLAGAFEDAGSGGVLIGMDTPQVTPALLDDALTSLDAGGVDAVLGRAPDGGWWALGLPEPDADVFTGVPMSTRSTGRLQQRRLRALGYRLRFLPRLRDVDRIDDARAVASAAPDTRFARVLRAQGFAWPDPVDEPDEACVPAWLETRTGGVLPLAVGRWHGSATDGERRVLERAVGPLIDIGCGPGRHVRALAERGVVALGIDVAPSAVALARSRGCVALERSVFARLPASGRWRSALLLDGNVGIGGDPVRLLGRIAEVLVAGGAVLVETEGEDVGVTAEEVRLVRDGDVGPWFPWARVGTGAIAPLAAQAGLSTVDQWQEGERWYAELRSI